MQPPTQEPPQGSLQDPLPRPPLFDRIDKILIVCLIAVFLCLFIWLLTGGAQPLFAYWTFIALLTLILVGILRAAGVVRTTGIALGGSAAIYVGLYWLTVGAFNKYYDDSKKIAALEERLASLQNQADPAKLRLQQYFGFLQQRKFADAYDIVSDARKQQRKASLPPGPDDYLQFVSTFEGTRGYKDFTYEFDRLVGEDRRYIVGYDVLAEVPHSALFESRGQSLSSFAGMLNREILTKLILDNIREYYIVPDQNVPLIRKYLDSRTLDDVVDPTFIAATVSYLRDVEKLNLQRAHPQPADRQVWRHFKHDILMTKERDAWKILSGLNNPVVALYK